MILRSSPLNFLWIIFCFIVILIGVTITDKIEFVKIKNYEKQQLNAKFLLSMCDMFEYVSFGEPYAIY